MHLEVILAKLWAFLPFASKVVRSVRMGRAWGILEHDVYRVLRHTPFEGRTLLLAISGGSDSMALAQILFSLQGALRLRLVVGHVHHGPHHDASIHAFRDQSAALVQDWCSKNNLEYRVTQLRPTRTGGSEEFYRIQRYEQLCEWQKELDAELVTAHHRDDLIETQMINLIRGSGMRGLNSLKIFDRNLRRLRPCLQIGRSQLSAFVVEHSVPFVEDPSNAHVDPLRNWMRNEWLPALESKRPGALQALARSLDLINGELTTDPPVQYETLGRRQFLELNSQSRGEAVVRLFRGNGVNSYTKAQVMEFCKRLDTPKKTFTFVCVNRVWKVDPHLVQMSRVGTGSGQSV